MIPFFPVFFFKESFLKIEITAEEFILSNIKDVAH